MKKNNVSVLYGMRTVASYQLITFKNGLILPMGWAQQMRVYWICSTNLRFLFNKRNTAICYIMSLIWTLYCGLSLTGLVYFYFFYSMCVHRLRDFVHYKKRQKSIYIYVCICTHSHIFSLLRQQTTSNFVSSQLKRQMKGEGYLTLYYC